MDAPFGRVLTAMVTPFAPDGALDVDGLDVSDDALDEAIRIDVAEWRAEVPLIEEFFATFGDRLPPALHNELETLRSNLG